MALSLIDRLLGRTETTELAVVEPIEAIEAKAAIGPGIANLMYGTPLLSLSRDPHRLMAEAQALFRNNMWVHTAEEAICNRLVGVPWHLEDEKGDTVDDTNDERYRVILKLLRRPNPNATYRSLIKLTARHLGLCGNAFWFLDQTEMLAGTPLQILYINPARMTPKTDENGNVRGWVLDDPENQVLNRMGADYQRTGTPLSKDEVIHFTLDEPDWGIWGIGIAEAAQRKIELDRLTDLHTGGVLGSGGRLAGLITPKTANSVSEDQWVQFVRDWRSITSDPDAAKRLQIAQMPLDFTQMTANPKDLQLIDVARANKEDIFAGWQVPLSQVGVITSRGLNSGESQGFDEASMMQGAVQPRGEVISETTQIRLLDRFADLGVTVTLVVDWPEFDDETPLYENASKAKTIPLTVDQRLEQVGKDPLDPDIYGTLGQAIFIDQTMVPLFPAAPEPAPPTPEEPENLPAVATDEETEVVEGKADLRKPLLGLRAKTEVEWEPKVRAVVQRILGEQRKYIAGRSEHIARKPSDVTSWWNEAREHRRFMTALEPTILDLARDVANQTTQTIKKPEGKADTWLERVLEAIKTAVGNRITGINATTKEKVQSAIAEGVERGLGAAELGTLIGDSAAFDEARAEMIGRTETMTAYNEAALHSYGQLDVEMVEAIDGDVDAECAARNGKRYPIDEAMGISDHPNGTLDWIPVVA